MARFCQHYWAWPPWFFCEGKYQQAQDLYGQALRLHPTTAGASVRVGFGLASYQLGQVDRAKASFRRALQLDPENVSAMVATAILTLASLDVSFPNYARDTERSMKLMSMAHLLDHSNAMVQNHLANHYFYKWSPLPGTVSVQKGSAVVKTSQPIPLDAGESIRIGMNFETIVQEEANEDNSIAMKEVWTLESNDNLKLWKKDYDRVSALAKGAYNSTTVSEMQAESLFQLGRVHHVRHEEENALKLYEKACKLAPDLTPARFGLAQTLLAQEDYKGSMTELKKVVLKSATATDALALLGLLQVRSGQMKEGLLNLHKAMDLDPLNPDLILLEALALQQDKSTYNKSLERYQKAVELLESSTQAVPYELYCNLGVLCHETKDYGQAMQHYAQALEALDSTSAAALKTTPAQVRHAANDMFWSFVDASTQAVSPSPEGSTTLTLEGESGLQKGDFVRIGEVFCTEIVGIQDNSIQLMEAFVPPPAEKAKEGENKEESKEGDDKEESKEGEDPMDVEESKEGEEAKKDGVEETKKPSLLKLYVKRENGRLETNQAITIAFNIARVHEEADRTVAAVELHKAIVKRVPSYVNSYLRLACIARDSGCLQECSAWLKIACTAAPGNPEVLTLVGNLHLSLCDWGPAQNVFDQLLMKRVASVEAYSKLSMGNIYFANLDHPKSYGKHLKKAVDLYKSILTKDNANAYAANGIGTVLAEKGELFKAKEVFNRVREVSGDSIADALLNLGHIYLAQRKHPEALQMYQSYMKRTQDGTAPITTKNREDDEAEVLLYIAFAYFDWARQTEALNNAQAAPADERYQKCTKHLELALQKSKRREVVLNYNLCMTKLQAANCVLQKLTRNIRRTAQEVEDALKGLEESLPKVEEMLKWKDDGKKVLIPKSMLQDCITHCKSNIESAKVHLEEERRKEQEAAEMREIQRSATEAQKQEAELRKVMQQETEAKEQEERDRRAATKMNKAEQLREGWVQEAESKQQEKAKKGKTGGRKGPPPVDGLVAEDEDAPLDETAALFDESSDEEAEGKQNGDEKDKDAEANKEDKPAATEKDLFGDTSDEESDEELVSSENNKRSGDDKGEDEEQPAKRQRVINDDDDE